MPCYAIAQAGWPATPLPDIARYATNAAAGGAAPALFLNACGSDWGQDINARLPDGTPVVSSVCYGPPGNDTSNGHYLYYYRDHLSQTAPEADLAGRIAWAAAKFKRSAEPLFLVVFGGLGLYGGDSDVHTFLGDVLGRLPRDAASPTFVAVGAQEMARLANAAAGRM